MTPFSGLAIFRALALALCALILETTSRAHIRPAYSTHELYCMDDIPYVGLFRNPPGDTPIDGVLECNHYYYCNSTAIEDNSLQAYRFNCLDVDPSRPYFDLKSCSCIASDAPCKSEYRPPKNNCVRPYEPTATEICRHWGTSGSFVMRDMANLEDPTKFWQCAEWNATVTYALPASCPYGQVFSLKTCQCESRGLADSIVEFNKHPMNHYRCSPPYKLPLKDVCQDEIGNRYVGQFPNYDTYDQDSYYDCIDTDSGPQAHKINCPPRKVFSFDTCGCATNDYDINRNFFMPNRYLCAKSIALSKI